jgi:transglutaminase-like putative cysteine protease
MRFYTEQECKTWLSDRKREKPDKLKDIHVEHVDYPPEPHRIFYIAHWIATHLTYRRPVLLWITEWGIWPSSENWHLYYKLRQSYGDLRLLHESPGHLFLEHEAEDLASFLQIAMLNGWGGYVLTQADYVNAFFSHDEYIDFFAKKPEELAVVREEFLADPPDTK